MEECSELTQALSKYLRYGNIEDIKLSVVEEIGDVLLCIEQLKDLIGITPEEITKSMNVKIDRQMRNDKKIKIHHNLKSYIVYFSIKERK